MRHLHRFSVVLTDEEWTHLQEMARRQGVEVDSVVGGAAVEDIHHDMRRESIGAAPVGGAGLEKYLGEGGGA